MEERKEKEKQFHDVLYGNQYPQRWSHEVDKVIQENPLFANLKYYSIERKSRKLVLDWYANNCKSKRVLDYCCGNGDDSFIIAQSGADEVIGIDISTASILNCRKRAKEKGFGEIVSFYEMDAETLKFPDNSFDVITEYGALHHLDLRKAYPELARVLHPGGKCICTEALGHNPVIQYYRKRTPHLRTKWEVEHLLHKREIEMAKKYFKKVQILEFFHLAVLIAVPFRNTLLFNPLLKMLEGLDYILLKLPVLKWQAWQIIFILSEPKE